MNAAASAAKQSAEAMFKPQPKQEEKQGSRVPIILESIDKISDAEFDRWKEAVQMEERRRIEAKREEYEQKARHEWEKDQEEFIRLSHKIHDYGGFRDSFIEAASKSNGAFSPNLLMIRDLPSAYLPEEIRPAGASFVKKKREGGTGRGGAASALSEKAPEKGAGGETQEEIIVRVVNEKKGTPMSLEDVIAAVAIDEVFGSYLKREPRGLSRKIGGVAKRGLIKKTPDGKYAPA